MGQAPIQIGWIPYWNLLPLKHELKRLSGGQIKLTSGHPSVVSRWLADGVVNLAPASSIALLKSRNLEMALPIGIASEGPVQSVYLGLHREHEAFWEFTRERQVILAERLREARRLCGDDMRQSAAALWESSRADRAAVAVPPLKLTTASAASAALTRVLLNLWLGENLASLVLAKSAMTQDEILNKDLGSRTMELVIGDEALQRRHEFWKVLDLGQIWLELTGLPFVFGLWQTNSQVLPPSIRYLVAEAASIAQARMRVEPCCYFPETIPLAGDGKDVDLAAYWKVIQYKLTERHLRSLLLYFSLYQRTCGRVEDELITERFVRWSKIWTGTHSIATR